MTQETIQREVKVTIVLLEQIRDLLTKLDKREDLELDDAGLAAFLADAADHRIEELGHVYNGEPGV